MRVQPQIQQPQEQERQSQRAQPQRRVESDNDQNEGWYGRPMMGRDWRYQQDWLQGGAGRGMMGGEGMRGAASMGSGMMMRMIFTLMDSDGDGSLSLEEFQAAHARTTAVARSDTFSAKSSIGANCSPGHYWGTGEVRYYVTLFSLYNCYGGALRGNRHGALGADRSRLECATTDTCRCSDVGFSKQF